MFSRFLSRFQKKAKFSDVVIATQKVKVANDQWIELRGLSANDVLLIINQFGSIVGEIFDGVDFNDEKLLAVRVFDNYSVVGCLAIALAADEPESVEAIMNLPFTVQIELAMAVYKLTFPEGRKSEKKLMSALTILQQR